MRCDNCGQGWMLTKTDEFNKLPPKFCPICGTETLRKQRHVLGTEDASCFKPFGPQLTALLYQEWRVFAVKANPLVSLQPRFLDFVVWYLEQPDPDGPTAEPDAE